MCGYDRTTIGMLNLMYIHISDTLTKKTAPTPTPTATKKKCESNKHEVTVNTTTTQQERIGDKH